VNLGWWLLPDWKKRVGNLSLGKKSFVQIASEVVMFWIGFVAGVVATLLVVGLLVWWFFSSLTGTPFKW
jgi:hypothetical protein